MLLCVAFEKRASRPLPCQRFIRSHAAVIWKPRAWRREQRWKVERLAGAGREREAACGCAAARPGRGQRMPTLPPGQSLLAVAFAGLGEVVAYACSAVSYAECVG